jgi:hypothetical protein
MKKVVVLLVVVSLFVPSLAFAGAPPVAFKCVFGDIGPNACCVYNCFDEAPLVTAWLWVQQNCFNLNSSASLSNSFAVDTREAAVNNQFNLGQNAYCVYSNWFVNAFFWINFRNCIRNECFPQAQ